MKISAYWSIYGIICTAFGLSYIAIPVFTGAIYGIPDAPYTVLMSRLFGAALFLIGLLFWVFRNLRDDDAQCALLKASVVAGIAGIGVSVWAALSGLVNYMAWSTVLLYVGLIVGALYFLSSPSRRT